MTGQPRAFLQYNNRTGGIEISCIRHYFEWRYFRPPGHCINQFRPGLDIYKSASIHPDISEKFPPGKHKAEPFDMSYYKCVWTLRHDIEKWDPDYLFVKNTNENWIIRNREDKYYKSILNEQGEWVWPNSLIIISDSDNPDTDNALGLYMPHSEFNKNETIGVNQTTGLIAYKDNRRQSINASEVPRRIPTMSKFGFVSYTNGILNRNRLPEDIYEAYRFDVFILKGSPNEIWETVQKIENLEPIWNFNINQEGWQGTSGFEYSSANSTISLLLNEKEESVYSPDSLLVDTDLHKFVSLRIKNQSTSTNLEFSFLKYNDEVRYKQVLNIQAESDQWQVIKLNISENPDWDGMIRNFELRIPASSGKLDFDLIAISADDGIIDCNGVFEGSAYLNNCGDCVGGNSNIRIYNEWNFDSLNNWVLNARLEGTANNGIANLSVTGNDPYMNFDGSVCLNTNEYKHLRVRITNNTDGTQAALFYQNDVTNTWKHKGFPVSNDGSNFKIYDINLANLDDWEGNIYNIRFDPPGSSGTFSLDYLALLKDNSYSLTVNNGTGGGSFDEGTLVNITAYPPPSAEQDFLAWTGDVTNVADIYDDTTTITMPAAAVELTPTFTDISYKLTVNNGTGGGSYPENTEVSITANAPPSVDSVFYQWTGDVANVANVNDDTTTVTMPAAAIELTATYEAISSIDKVRPLSRESGVQIYPNPARGIIIIEATEAFEIVVFDVVGQILYNKQYSATSCNIDVSSWKGGIYFVNIQCAGKVYNQKLIVE